MSILIVLGNTGYIRVNTSTIPMLSNISKKRNPIKEELLKETYYKMHHYPSIQKGEASPFCIDRGRSAWNIQTDNLSPFCTKALNQQIPWYRTVKEGTGNKIYQNLFPILYHSKKQ